jgi:DNA-binding winged helix-turn-helix (wHTH) protein
VEYPRDVLIGDWLIQPGLNRASRADTTIHLRPQLVDVLMCLAHQAGRTVSRNELMDRVWPGQSVADSALPRCVAELRSALGDHAQTPGLIETIPKRGYRLIARVAPVDNGGSPASETRLEAAPQTSAVAAAVAATDPAIQNSPTQPRGARRLLWPLMTASLAVAVVVLVAFVYARPTSPKAELLPTKNTIAVSFANSTGDPAFDETVPMALAIQIEQPPAFRITPQRYIQDALLRMKQPANALVTPELALDLCDKLGTRAVLRCSITSVGREYVVGLEATGCESRQTIARAQQQAGSKEQVLEALSMAAGSLRLQLGESFAGYSHSEGAAPGWTPPWSGTKRAETMNSNK